MPKRFKESSIGATLVYIVIGLIVGTAITAFLIVPSVRNKQKKMHRENWLKRVIPFPRMDRQSKIWKDRWRI